MGNRVPFAELINTNCKISQPRHYYATTRNPSKRQISRLSLTSVLEDRQESIKKKPNDNLQYHLFVKEFNDLI